MAGRIDDLQPWLVPYARYLLDVARYNGLNVTVTSVRRSRAQQQHLYDRWRRGVTDIPAAPPGSSLHEHGLAFDLVVNSDYRGPAQAALGRFWQSMGGRWGGAVDPVHFYVS